MTETKYWMRRQSTRLTWLGNVCRFLQRSLLKLRERALKEKTRAELAWLEQQKQRHRDKGADEIYPQIKKRERALVMKLRQEKVSVY